MKENVAIFINSLEGGGAERVVSLLLKSLESKFKVHLILLENKREFEVPNNVCIYLLSEGRKSRFYQILSLPFLALRLNRYFRENNIDICISFLSRPNFILGFSKLFKTSTRCIINERTCTSSYHLSLGKFSACVSAILVRKLYPLADLIISNSKYSRMDLIKNFGIPTNKTEVIYNPIALHNVYRGHLKMADHFTFVHVGKFRPEKNHLLLINAFEKIKQLPVKLIFIGKGPTESLARVRVEELGLTEKISFVGFYANPFELISQCDCMVLSSNFEGFPNVLLEGMSCNVPIISTDCFSGPRELLAPDTDFTINLKSNIEIGQYGILTPTNNDSLMADAMKLMFTDKVIYNEYKEKSSKRIKEFDINIVIKKYENIINQRN